MRSAVPFLLFAFGCKDPLVVKEYLALVSVSPTQGATQVAVDTDVIAGFSEPLLSGSVDAQSVYLEDGTGMPIVASVTYNATAHWVVVDPEADLAPATEYRITFTSDIQGKHSGNLLAPLQSTFTTAGSNPSNDLPIANAGPDQQVNLGPPVQLNGSNSEDPEGAALSFTWRMVSTPSESAATIADTNVAQPRFTPDIQGEYIAGLMVNDGMQDSSEDFIVVQVLGLAPPDDSGSPDTGTPPTDTGSSGTPEDDTADDPADDPADDTADSSGDTEPDTEATDTGTGMGE
jgi:hypothetical protein